MKKFFIVLAIIFAILAFDRIDHYDSACYLAEASYGRDQFPCLYYDHFRLHIFLVTALVSVVGQGLAAYYAIKTFYMLILIGFAYICYLCAKEFFSETKSRLIMMFILLNPITLFLGYKVLGEAPALFLAALSLYVFIKAENMWMHMLSGILMYFAALARMDAPIVVLAFIGLYVIFTRKKEGLVAPIAFFAIFVAVLLTTAFNPFNRFMPNSVLGVEPHWGQVADGELHDAYYGEGEPAALPLLSFNLLGVLYYAALAGGGFWLFFIAGLSKRKETLFSVLWYVLATLPVKLIIPNGEVRYLYLNIIPFSVIAAQGIVYLRKYGRIVYAVLVLAVLANVFVVGYYSIGIDEKEMNSILEDGPVLLPNSHFGDYAFLAYTRPDLELYAVQSVDYHGHNTTKFMKYLFKDRYISSLSDVPANATYLCMPERADKRKLIVKLKDSFTDIEYTGTCELSWLYNNTYTVRSNSVYEISNFYKLK